jgi:hypothetical protein
MAAASANLHEAAREDTPDESARFLAGYQPKPGG